MKQLKPLESMIFTIRNHKVIIDADLAALYNVPTKALNQAVKRNENRFPRDFVFRLTAKERLEVVTHCDHLARLT
ncbi:MAG: ORF6N domain-containing protein [Nitrospira sp.]|nr:ORF6N domain-containing protein [Nitrospira sp.]MDH4370330.1 ORF6N domain-containing protein [Nitrospira sp.]MDH5348802.1 ORF6N domain-containing protein [Nitrospira sp.]MDH5498335.1 ORF6N domain-containing protein [Nitrospira sp.]MDH5725209.1 ORF6N domain-containing protein [Nitrospira sp.]